MIVLAAGGAILLAVVLLLALAGVTGAQQIARKLPLRIPVINYDLGGAIARGIGVAVAAVSSWLWAGVHPALQFLWAPYELIRRLVGDATTAIEAAVSAVGRVEHRITAVWDRINQFVIRVEQGAAADLARTTRFLEADITASVSAVDHRITAVWTRVNRYVAATGAAAATDLRGAIDTVDHTITTTAGSIEHRITEVWDRINRYVAQVEQGAVSDVTVTRQWAAQGLDTLRDDLTREVEASRAYTADAVAAAEALIGAYLSTTIAPAIAITATEVDDCLRPNCDAIKTVAGALHGLEGLLELGFLAAFIAALYEDPSGVAQAITTLGTPMRDLVDGVIGGLLH